MRTQFTHCKFILVHENVGLEHERVHFKSLKYTMYLLCVLKRLKRDRHRARKNWVLIAAIECII